MPRRGYYFPGDSMKKPALTIGYDGRPVVYRWTGMRTYTVSLIDHLLRLVPNVKVQIYYHHGEPDTAMANHPNLTWRSVSAPTGWWWTFFQIPAVLRQEKVDLFHADYIVPPLASVPTVVTVHDAISALFLEPSDVKTRVLTNALTFLSVHRSRFVLVPSRSAQKDVARLFRAPLDRLVVTPYGVGAQFRPGDKKRAIQRLTDRFQLPESFILTVNFFRPRKNAPLLAAAFRELKRRKVPVKGLVYVGGCPQSVREKVLLAAGEWGPFVHFTGYVDDEWLPDFYRACDVFAFPSLYEGFGLPVLEAMSCRAPVVVSDAPALCELVGDAGRIVPAKSLKDLTDALEEILTSPDLREILSQRGRQRAEQFTWDQTARISWSVYQKAVGQL
ncbi:MAG: glycosyltransferase family 4 protein [Armatimonadetes bacterium]|nr:glycosyltransferase family 4 protein [Armatimonadota bacterium]MDW8122671.1 glycosyltransferase family 1 protein [Armatimonadota bacterium]